MSELMKSEMEKAGSVKLDSLETLWFQLAGTICNLSCSHCFISCSPENDSFGFMNRETVSAQVSEAQKHGVKEFYFTGGETFLNKEIYDILEDTLKIGPVSILTNGTVIRQRVAEKLKRISDNTIYSLELRVSLDGFTAESNDHIRGAGSFDSALKGILALVNAGFLPIVTAVQTWPESESQQTLEAFKSLLNGLGYERPRIKILPALNLGEYRSSGFDRPEEYLVTEDMLQEYDSGRLLCSNSRIVTDKGVFVCPILIDSPDARMGDSVDNSMGPYKLQHKACYTCYQFGAICSNFSTSATETSETSRSAF
jgi:AdoMet-dependent heme synthase